MLHSGGHLQQLSADIDEHRDANAQQAVRAPRRVAEQGVPQAHSVRERELLQAEAMPFSLRRGQATSTSKPCIVCGPLHGMRCSDRTFTHMVCSTARAVQMYGTRRPERGPSHTHAMRHCEGCADAERSKPYLSQQESDPPEGIELGIDLHAHVDLAMH